MEINYQSDSLQDIFKWEGGLYPIENALQNHKQCKRSTKQLAKCNLMFLDQLIDKDNNMLIPWQILISLLNKNNKGRTPKWYNLIKNKITSGEDNKLKKEYRISDYINSHYKWTTSISSDGRKKE